MDNELEQPGSCELAKWVSEDFDAMRKGRRDLEEKWNRNFDAYNNVDDATKKKWKEGEGDDWRSRSFIGVTRQKIMAAYSLICDMTLRGGRLPMILKREKALEEPEPEPMVSMVPGEREGAAPTPVAVPDRDVGAKGMEDLINAQCDVGKADVTYKTSILSGCVFGVAWTKKGVTEVVRTRRVRTPMGWEAETEVKTVPSVSYVPVWDIFHDMEADDIDEFSGICHRRLMSANELRKLIGKASSGYIEKAILDVLSGMERVPGKSDVKSKTLPAGMGLKEYFGGEDWNRGGSSGLTPALRDIQNRKRNIEVVERWGKVPRKLVEAFESGTDAPDFSGESSDVGDEVECVCTLASDKIIRFARTRVEDRPFCRFVFEKSLDGVEGVGLADKIEHEQRVLNGAVRAFEDNARLSGDVMFAVKRRFIVDQDKLKIRPGGCIDIEDACQDARQAIQQLVVQNVGSSYQEIIALIERYAEESSMIPRITQGAAPIYNKTTTLGEINQQTDKAGKYMATVIQNIDDGLVEPWGSYFLDWNMDDPSVPDEIKGSYYVVPTGATSYEDKVIKYQHLNGIMSAAAAYPPLASMIRNDTLARLLAELLDLDHDELVKSAAQLEEERAAQEAERERDMESQALVAKTMAQAEKIKADTQAKMAKVGQDDMRIGHEAERLKIERARLVGDLQEQAMNGVEKPSSSG